MLRSIEKLISMFEVFYCKSFHVALALFIGIYQFSLGGLKFFLQEEDRKNFSIDQRAEYITVFIHMQSKHSLPCLACIVYCNHNKNSM